MLFSTGSLALKPRNLSPTAPVDDSAGFALPVNAAAPSEAFEGTLTSADAAWVQCLQGPRSRPGCVLPHPECRGRQLRAHQEPKLNTNLEKTVLAACFGAG